MKREDYEILNMSNEENAELEMAKMECESNINEQKQRNKKVIFGVIIGIVVIGLALVLLLSLLNNQKLVNMLEQKAARLFWENQVHGRQ